MVEMTFDPLLPLGIIVALLALPTVIILTNLIMRRRASLLRLLALVAFALALMQPVMINQEREPTQATVVVIVDRSQSQKIGNRTSQTNEALAQLKAVFAALPQFDIRIVEIDGDGQNENGLETRLIEPLRQAFADIQPSRQGGAILITDGQIHDIPAQGRELEFVSPINALITGNEDEYDRQIRITAAPSFGLVGQNVRISFQIDDVGQAKDISFGGDVTLLVNGTEVKAETVALGMPIAFDFDLPLAGKNIIELVTSVVTGELTPTNNRVAVTIEGVRENLKTLLVSGEPHNGLRLWRDLLKSDPGIDLIHFTILRPPEKFDDTPTHELSLISFPTTELFVDKIDDFDLIILDRYQHYEILPLIYYDFIAEYVKKGGALLLVAGPEYADISVTLARTPLVSVLPAHPTGSLVEQAFLPQLTDMGKKHPVTRDLEAAQNEPPEWGRWLRQIDVDRVDVDTRVLLAGADNKPLMLLGTKEQGRIGMILSDQAWLWARGFEGGGPYASLYRRMAYWLLKQPELEEESLSAAVQKNRITIVRQTMLDENQELSLAKITLPSGQIIEQKLGKQRPGRLEGSFISEEVGLFRIENGDKVTFALIGSLEAPEFTELVSTSAKLESLIRASGGSCVLMREAKPSCPLCKFCMRVSVLLQTG